LRQKGFGALVVGLVGAVLDGEIGIVDDRQQLAFPDGLAGTYKHLDDLARHLGADLRVDDRFQGTERLLGDFHRAGPGLGDGDQGGRRAGGFFSSAFWQAASTRAAARTARRLLCM